MFSIERQNLAVRHSVSIPSFPSPLRGLVLFPHFPVAFRLSYAYFPLFGIFPGVGGKAALFKPERVRVPVLSHKILM